MNRLFLAATALAGALGFVGQAEAQIRIGPWGGVNIRAPFVAVDVLPFGGGTRVRAPFTAVDTRAYAVGARGIQRNYRYADRGYYGPSPYVYGPAAVIPVPIPVPVPVYGDPFYPVPIYGRPVLAAPDYVYVEPYADPIDGDPGVYANRGVGADPVYGGTATDARDYWSARQAVPEYENLPMDPAVLTRQLRSAAERLSLAISRRSDDADIWMNFLGPDVIIETIDRDGNPQDLEKLLMNYEGLSGNAQLSGMWLTDGFRQTHSLLRQWVESAVMTDDPAVAPPVEPVAVEAATDEADTQTEEAGIEEVPLPRPTTSL
ncbi:hypothetical protein K227x_50930 [Rubripirellula lacrimiformis]|uniref:Uncharacterized protein n=1 Tax=Rubripirellula lacrimiformis TaxID=1930273 RepID=A0A517NHQ7_9BACT|nr:hypothetical protein [Rubripirellula lacrimiformis]QDT06677.1 hypothetical protein K227x_50930 [Rubripirellula lacrimiformis]